MLAQPSVLSLSAAGFYMVVLLASVAASQHARPPRKPSWHFRTWIGLAACFALLSVFRLLNVEEVARVEMRNFIRLLFAYEERRDWQAAVLAVVAAISVLSIIPIARNTARFRRSRAATLLLMAVVAAMGMLFLILIRLVSLHSIDVLLYAYKLNWIFDLGLSLVVLVSAVLYTLESRLVARKPSAKQNARPR